MACVDETPRGVLGGKRRSHSWRRDPQRGVSLTVKQVLAAFLEQTADVEWDEELRSKRVTIQVTGQRKGTLQNRDQQKATGGGFSMPTLDLEESTKTNTVIPSFARRREKCRSRSEQPRWRHAHGLACSLPRWAGSWPMRFRQEHAPSNLLSNARKCELSTQFLFTAQASAISVFLLGGRDWREPSLAF